MGRWSAALSTLFGGETGKLRVRASAGQGLEAGQTGTRRLRNFQPSREHINGLLQFAGDTTTARARWLVRNNGYASNAIDVWASDTVGAGIKPSSLLTEAGLKDSVQKLWLRWTDEADSEGITDFYGLLRRAARECFIAGEVFFRLRPRLASDGLSVPLQLQMLPSEMLDLTKTQPLSGGRQIRQGIEFDAIGRRVAYWFFRRHPNDSTDMRFEGELYTRVAANEVIHVFDPVEAGQIRGVSKMAPAIVKLFMLDSYDDAELDRKKVAALFAGFVTDGPDAGDIVPMQEDQGDGTAIAPLEPGLLQFLPPGKDIKFAEPADVGANYEAFQYRVLLAVFAAMGIPYQSGSGDVLKANYSNIRASSVTYRRKIEPFQHSVMVFQAVRPVWRAFWRSAVLAGALPVSAASFQRDQAGFMAAKFIPPRWEWTDPWKDLQSEKLAVDNGFKARSDVIEEMGFDAEEVDARIAADRAREKAMGLTFAAAGIPISDGAAKELMPTDATTDKPQDQAAA